MAIWPSPKTINLAVQAGNLQKHFPNSRVEILRSALKWRAKITPSPLSQTYDVKLSYKLGSSPRVELVSPPLETRDGRKPTHLYEGDRLCLYLPNADEWNASMLLVDTIVPWTAEWLLNYEIWLATGEWCGGGIHPQVSPKAPARDRSIDGAAGFRRNSVADDNVVSRSGRFGARRRPR